MLLSSLLNGTFLSAGSKGVDVEQLLSKLLDWGIEVGKDLLGAIIIYIVVLYHQASRTFACTHSGKEKA